MANYGNLKWDDFSTSLQSDIATTASGGRSGIIGYGFNPLGAIKRIDDNDPSIQYTGYWVVKSSTNKTFREGSPFNYHQALEIGASLKISFIGTGICIQTYKNGGAGIITYSVDGGASSSMDLYSSTLAQGVYLPLVENLSYGYHTITITMSGKNPNVTSPSFLFSYADILAQPTTTNLLPPFTEWNDGALQGVGSTRMTLSPYSIQIYKPSGITGYVTKEVMIPINPSQTYTLTFNVIVSNIAGTVGAGGYYNLYPIDVNGNTGGGLGSGSGFGTSNGSFSTPVTFTTPSNAVKLKIVFGVDTTPSGTFTFTNSSLVLGSTALPFDTNGYDKVALAKDSLWNKSSAFVGGNRINATTDLTKSINEITNLLPNASFERINPVWQNVFSDDFNRANGAVGNGWSSGTISSNQLSVSTSAVNGSTSWTDRQMKFSFVANTAVALYAVIKASSNIVNAVFLSNQLFFEKTINGVTTTPINPASFALTNGTTYYVTMKAQGNLYSASITSNPDYVTGATTIYCYEENVPTGSIYFISSSGSVLVDNVAVTTPTPDSWTYITNTSSTGYISYNGDTAKISGMLSGTDNILRSSNRIPIVAGQPYTFSVMKKMDSYTSGSCFLEIAWFNGVTYLTSTVSSNFSTIDSAFTQLSASATSPATATMAEINIHIGQAVVSIKNPIFTMTASSPTWHTKESRCDLISLQNDGQVITTQGNGSSELGYRVEAEDGSISTFWRDKNSVHHWDRVKVWNSGAWNLIPNSGSNNARYVNATANDVYYISFVGTGLDLVRTFGSDSGFMAISIDGGTEFVLDGYMPNAMTQVRVPLARNLSYGQHTVKIRVTGTKNTLSSNTYVDVDAFDIYVPAIPANPSPTTLLPVSAVIKADPDYGWIRYEENEGVLYSGTGWATYPAFDYSGGTLVSGGVTNSYFEFAFVGTGVRWIDRMIGNRGIAAVSIDGGTEINVDQYGAVSNAVVPIYTTNTAFGFHKIKVRVTGTKNASSSDSYISVDAFDVKNSMYVIDLRKSQTQLYTEQKIAEHEAKDLFDAHPQAIKGKNNKERRESGMGNINVATAGTQVQLTVTFAKAFTVPPDVKVTLQGVTVAMAGYCNVTGTSGTITTTGFTIFANSYLAQGLGFIWEAIGY